MSLGARIHWSLEADVGVPLGTPDPERWESLDFPPPWRDRPWPPRDKYGVSATDAQLGLAP